MDVQHLDQAEDIEIRLFSRDEVMDMLEKGEIWQSLMAAPLWKYLRKQSKLQGFIYKGQVNIRH